MKKVKLYGCPKEMVSAYKKVVDITNVHVSSLSDEDLNKTVEEIFEIDHEYMQNFEINHLFMLMQGFDRDTMMSYLNQLKELDMPFGGIKIVQTDHNKNWRIRDLFDEVLNENELFKKSEVLKQFLLSTNAIDMHSLHEDIQRDLKEKLMKSYMILQSPKRSLDEVNQCISDIVKLLKQIQ